MRSLRVAVFAAFIAAGLGLLQIGGARAAAEKQPIAYSIQLHATIDPATERWMHKALNEAKDKNATVAIVRIDTPGGLDGPLHHAVRDVAAMAPQTNIGSATPIDSNGQDIGGTLGRKITNDAAAYVRALTSSHGRNADVAEQMVRKATNMTATEALNAHLIDVVAGDQTELLQKLDGFQVKGPKAQTLHTANLKVVNRDMPFQYDLLEILVNPTVAYLLLTAGFAGLAFEFFSPGAVAPGVLGALALLLGLFGTAQLPVNAAGVVLFLTAIVLFILELKVGGHAIFGVGGVIALIAS